VRRRWNTLRLQRTIPGHHWCNRRSWPLRALVIKHICKLWAILRRKVEACFDRRINPVSTGVRVKRLKSQWCTHCPSFASRIVERTSLSTEGNIAESDTTRPSVSWSRCVGGRGGRTVYRWNIGNTGLGSLKRLLIDEASGRRRGNSINLTVFFQPPLNVLDTVSNLFFASWISCCIISLWLWVLAGVLWYDAADWLNCSNWGICSAML